MIRHVLAVLILSFGGLALPAQAANLDAINN